MVIPFFLLTKSIKYEDQDKGIRPVSGSLRKGMVGKLGKVSQFEEWNGEQETRSAPKEKEGAHTRWAEELQHINVSLALPHPILIILLSYMILKLL